MTNCELEIVKGTVTELGDCESCEGTYNCVYLIETRTGKITVCKKCLERLKGRLRGF